MATIRIYTAQLHVQTTKIAVEVMEELLYEIDFKARARASGGPYSTGQLAGLMYKDGPHVIGERVTGRVGNRANYAASVDGGARIHAIFPKRGSRNVSRFGSRKAPQLKFFWRKVGHIVYMPHIPGSPGRIGLSHPGQRASGFLTLTAISVARQHGFKITIRDVEV